ncbi:MAG: HlyD family efflux transporter periplasmic adaptor subunit [Planctomycetes bacterium]|nr:HlyD family efflux transporter periplasmic adaptor subunit [Planctomycetota bacterium]
MWLVIAVVGVGYGYYWYQEQQKSTLPAGIVSGNGRIESIQVDVAAKYGGRVSKMLAKEGDLVEAGQTVAVIDTTEMEAELATAKAKTLEAEETEAQIKSDIVKSEAELLFSQQQLDRAKTLFAKATISKEEFDEKQTVTKSATAALESTKAKLRSTTQSAEAARAETKRIQAKIDDSTLKSPVKGKVLYRLAEEGEVLAAGGKALTLVNLNEFYMEIFLPAMDAAKVIVGADAKITIDVRPGAAAPATVTFVSPEAQFTPKQVETRSERDKLMFRVKLRVPPEIVAPYVERIKTGIRGVGYVRIDKSVEWPSNLSQPLPPPPAS